jgi:hypothetical protein
MPAGHRLDYQPLLSLTQALTGRPRGDGAEAQ